MVIYKFQEKHLIMKCTFRSHSFCGISRKKSLHMCKGGETHDS